MIVTGMVRAARIEDASKRAGTTNPITHLELTVESTEPAELKSRFGPTVHFSNHGSWPVTVGARARVVSSYNDFAATQGVFGIERVDVLSKPALRLALRKNGIRIWIHFPDETEKVLAEASVSPERLADWFQQDSTRRKEQVREIPAFESIAQYIVRECLGRRPNDGDEDSMVAYALALHSLRSRYFPFQSYGDPALPDLCIGFNHGDGEATLVPREALRSPDRGDLFESYAFDFDRFLAEWQVEIEKFNARSKR